MLFGVVADDLTGAVDIATCLSERGLRTVIVTEVPHERIVDIDACVVALKSRNVPPEEAVRLSIRAAKDLLGWGIRTLYFKYCSTFDSTADGNIGPVADALLRLTGQRIAVVAPGYPANGRTVYQRHLFVGSQLLSHSSMRHHPLTPMCDSDVVTLLEAQSVNHIGHVPLERIRRGETVRALSELADAGCRMAVVDTVSDEDLDLIAEACLGDELVTGGAGLASAMARRHGRHTSTPLWQAPPGRGGTIAGSCATTTLRQIADYAAHGPVFAVEPWRCADVDSAAALIREATDWAMAQPSGSPFLIASSADEDTLRAVQREFGTTRSAEMVERVLGEIALTVVEAGVTRLLVAGGETSGSVIRALGISRLEVKALIGPGLAWCSSDRGVAVSLKSGNFGSDNLFRAAHSMLVGNAP